MARKVQCGRTSHMEWPALRKRILAILPPESPPDLSRELGHGPFSIGLQRRARHALFAPGDARVVLIGRNFRTHLACKRRLFTLALFYCVAGSGHHSAGYSCVALRSSKLFQHCPSLPLVSLAARRRNVAAAFSATRCPPRWPAPARFDPVAKTGCGQNSPSTLSQFRDLE